MSGGHWPGYRLPEAVCAECGRRRPCYYARTERPLCSGCRNRGWRPPPAVCSVCGRERPCHHAHSDAPVCQSCSRGRLARREHCAFCGRNRRVAARTPRGPQCSRCRSRALQASVDCVRCGAHGRASLGEPGVCARCAGEPPGPVCRACGAEGENYAARRCARCVLVERLETLTGDGDPAAVGKLEPYLAALKTGPKPRSVLDWIRRETGYATLRELVRGERELSHEALDQVDRGQSTTYLRAALVRHGVLPERHDQLATLEGWIAGELARLPETQGRAHLHAFARWQVQHDVLGRARRGQATRRSHRLARARVRTAADLLLWLEEQDLGLGELRQELLDRWLAEGSSARRRVRAFVRWAARAGLTPPLDVPWHRARVHAVPPGDAERLALLRRLLTDERLDLRDRVAGTLLLLFGQPLSRQVLFTVDDVKHDGGRVTLRIGNDPLELPEPLAGLVLRLADERPRLATTGAGEPPRWLFPGFRLDAPMHDEHLRRRLRALGLNARGARAGALLRLARELPPAILADLLGISESRAARWAKLAGGEWVRYAAHRA